jgi:hypothetical protein
MRAAFSAGFIGDGVCLLFSAAALMLAGCGPGRAGASSPAGASGGEEGGLEAKFEREAEPMQKHVVRAGDVFTAYIEASAAPTIERKDQGVTVTADLGWESPVQCFIYDHVIDAGSAANTMLKAAAKDVKFKALTPYFMDHQALDPVMAIRGVYHVEREGTLLAGDFKLMVMPRAELPMMCWHDAPGYAKSFARVTSEFAKSFQYKSTQPKPMRGELWIVHLDDLPVGFSRDSTYSMDDGNVRRVSLGARFLPTGPGEMSFDDDVEVITSDKEGSLATGKYFSTENGETALTIDIERTKTGYNYVGTIQNKEVKGSFKSKQALKARYASEKKFKTLAAGGKKAKFEQVEYVPSIDAAGGSKVSYDVSPQAGEMIIVSTMGQRSMTMRANGRGVVNELLMAVGSKKVQVKLVEESGEL